jgi:hypothetical protein
VCQGIRQDIYVCVCVCVCLYVNMCVCVYRERHTHTHTHTEFFNYTDSAGGEREREEGGERRGGDIVNTSNR